MDAKVICAFVGAALALALAGCSSPVPETAAPGPALAAEEQAMGVDARLVRCSAYPDYDVFPTLTSAAESLSVAVAGRVVGWTEGRSIIAAGVADRFAVLTVEVDEAAKVLDPGQKTTIYVSVARGVEALDETGNPIIHEGRRSAVCSMEELKRAVPVGTRVIVLGMPTVSVAEQEYAPHVTVESPDAGLPAGGTLVDPYPQGLIFETASGGFVSGRAVDEDLARWAAHAATEAGNAANKSSSPGSFNNLVDELGRSLRR